MILSRFCRRCPLFSLPIVFMALFLICVTDSAEAQDNDDFQQWTLITVTKDLPPRFRAYFEVQPRLGSDAGRLERLLIRPALGYRLSPKVSAWLGYGYTPLFSPRYSEEHRIFQQLLVEDKRGRLSITNRTRLEQRFIRTAGDVSVRFRHFLRLAHPIRGIKPWSVIGYEEFFFNLNNTPNGPKAGFDQNRLYLGVGRPFGSVLRAEVGYMLNTLNPPNNRPDRLNHVLLVTLNFVWS